MTDRILPDTICKTVVQITLLHTSEFDPINCFTEDLLQGIQSGQAIAQKEVVEETVTAEGEDAVIRLAIASGFEEESLEEFGI